MELLKRLSDAYPNGRLEPAFSIELPGGVPMRFQFIPAGKFPIGCREGWSAENPVHRVRLTQSFLLGSYVVTRQQFEVWTRLHGVDHRDGFQDWDRGPATKLLWSDAVAFCTWLSGSGVLPHGWRASLPTEAQWEYACRAGSETDYHSGDGMAALSEVAWFDQNSELRLHSVGELKPNDWGLFDMHGNVWEWCLDVWDEQIYRKRPDGVVDPVRLPLASDDDDKIEYVLRGGSCYNSAMFCRASFRSRWAVDLQGRIRGFRVCLLPDASTGQVEVPGDRNESCVKRTECCPDLSKDGVGGAGAQSGS